MQRGLNLPEGVDGVYRPAFEGAPWLACQLASARKYPNIAPTNPNLFQNWIPFLGNLHAPFYAGLRVIKGRSQLKWGKVKLKSCKSERIVPIWGVVRKSKCQLGRKSGVSERRNPFLGFEQIRWWRLQIQRWGRVKLGGMFESEAYFASFNPLFCKLAQCPLVEQPIFVRARIEIVENSKFSMERSSHLFNWCKMEQSIECVKI